MSDLISLRRTASRLGVSRKTVMLLVTRGRLTGLKVGRQWRFDPADIDIFIETQKSAVVPREGKPLITVRFGGRHAWAPRGKVNRYA